MCCMLNNKNNPLLCKYFVIFGGDITEGFSQTDVGGKATKNYNQSKNFTNK